MADYPIGGAQARLAYGWEETAFATVSSSIDKAFSQGVRLSSLEIDNSVDYVGGLGSQDVQKSICRELKGTWGVEFVLSDPWFLTAILGQLPTDGGAAPYTHTWDSTTGIDNTQLSMSLDLGYELDTNSHQILLGCVANTMSLTANVGETIKVRLDGNFANLTKDETIIAIVLPVEEPFSFAQSTLEFPNGNTVADVQSVELSWNRNGELIGGLGSRYAQQKCAKLREWVMRVTVTYENDSDFLDPLLGDAGGPITSPAEVATARFTISNGLTGSDMRKFVFSLANVRVERRGTSAAVEDTIKQDLVLRARTLTNVVVSNDTSAAL